jgi:hypothetical protein
MSRGAPRLAGAALLLVSAGLLATACAGVPEPPPLALLEPKALLSRLVADQAAVRSVRGRASVRYDGPSGSGSASQVILVSLPDRARLETLSPLGTTLLVLTIRGTDLAVHSPVRHEYGVGRATRETLGRLARAPVPPELLLRLLVGLPPLPVHPGDPRLRLVEESGTIRVESVEGPFWQRLWTASGSPGVDHGEVGEAARPLLTFQFGERRWLGGSAFPFAVRIEELTGGNRLTIQYETARLNDPLDADLFELPRPTDGRTRIIDLGGALAPPRDLDIGSGP